MTAPAVTISTPNESVYHGVDTLWKYSSNTPQTGGINGNPDNADHADNDTIVPVLHALRDGTHGQLQSENGSTFEANKLVNYIHPDQSQHDATIGMSNVSIEIPQSESLNVALECSIDQSNSDEGVKLFKGTRGTPQSDLTSSDIENVRHSGYISSPSVLESHAECSLATLSASERRENISQQVDEDENNQSAASADENINEPCTTSLDHDDTIPSISKDSNTLRFLAQLSLHCQTMTKHLRRQSSTIVNMPQKRQPKLEVNSLLDLLFDVNEDNMTWRNEMLSIRFMAEKRLLDGIHILNKRENSLFNPVQENKCLPSTMIAERPTLSKSYASASLYSGFPSLSSVLSAISYSILPTGGANNKQTGIRERRSQKFLDLTSFHEGDDDGDIYEPPKVKDNKEDDDDMSVVSSYSIQVRIPKCEVSTRSKLSRNFLDLTLETPPRRGSMIRLGATRSLIPIYQEDDEYDQKSNPDLSVSDISNVGADTRCEQSTSNVSDDEEDSISHERDVFTSDAWERADAAFISDVHDVAYLLEKNLMIKGLESPFWRFDEITPRFKQLHEKMKENFNRCVLEMNAVQSPLKFSHQATRDTEILKSGTGKFGRRLSLELKYDTLNGRCRDPPTATHTNAALDVMMEFDDLQDGLRWRDDRDFVRNFLYQKRHDDSVTLPFVLSRGLDKRLTERATDTAVAIIDELTNPLRAHRYPVPKECSSDEMMESCFFQMKGDIPQDVPSSTGIPTLQPNLHPDFANESNVPSTLNVHDRFNGRDNAVPMRSLVMLERFSSCNSSMTIESTDRSTLAKAGVKPTKGNRFDFSALFAS